MTSPPRFPVWPLALAVGLNGLLAVGCAALVVVAPSRAAALVAAGGFVFFGVAAAGFALMLRLRLAAH